MVVSAPLAPGIPEYVTGATQLERVTRSVASLLPILKRRSVGAGDENRTRMTSLEGWGSAIELHPRAGIRLGKSSGCRLSASGAAFLIHVYELIHGHGVDGLADQLEGELVEGAKAHAGLPDIHA